MVREGGFGSDLRRAVSAWKSGDVYVGQRFAVEESGELCDFGVPILRRTEKGFDISNGGEVVVAVCVLLNMILDELNFMRWWAVYMREFKMVLWDRRGNVEYVMPRDEWVNFDWNGNLLSDLMRYDLSGRERVDVEEVVDAMIAFFKRSLERMRSFDIPVPSSARLMLSDLFNLYIRERFVDTWNIEHALRRYGEDVWVCMKDVLRDLMRRRDLNAEVAVDDLVKMRFEGM